MSQNHIILTIIALLSCSFLFFVETKKKTEGLTSLEGVALTSINGQQFKLAGQFTEKPVLFVFWSTTCGSCIEEIPFISKLHETLKDKITIIGIHPNFPLKKVQKFIRKYKPAIPYTIAIDSQDSLCNAYKVTVLPRTLLVDNKGKILYDHSGYSPENEKEVENAIISHAIN